MKISYNWLKTIINIDLPASEIASLLTASGLEVEGIENFESLKGGLKGLVVGHILEIQKHPDADRLNLTKVDIGNGAPLSIVCGASNVAAGQKVIVATVGTQLFPTNGEPFEIKKSKIRGALSEGMICAEDEIGLGSSHDGIMVLPAETKTGMPASDFFKIETDQVFEIGLTPNRSDAASHLGVARDLAAIINSSNNNSKIQIELQGLQQLPEASQQEQVQIIIDHPEACQRFSGLVLRDIQVGESPIWLQNRLKALGVRPINNIVDITNFVLHELGQPLHAFDLNAISGNTILVRTPKIGEKLVTLDSVERTLAPDDLLICNQDEPMSLAGIFGGKHSGVTENTKAVFIESAYFNPSYIRKTSKYHGLKTDASFRFERGTDPEMTVKALIRAANLILELAGGKVSMELTDIYPEKLAPYTVAFSLNNCNDLIGKELDRNVVKTILTNLDIEIDSEGSDGLLLKVPRYKTDVTREADVIEEVMRIYGYNNVEVSKAISYTAFNEPENFDIALEDKASGILEGFGFNEIMNLSLGAEKNNQLDGKTIKLINPLSQDLNVLRTDMLMSGLEALAYNINRRNTDLKLFEIGRTYFYHPEAAFKYLEQKNLSIFVSGNLFNENPYGLKHKADFSFLKAAVSQLLEKCGMQNLKSTESEYAHFEFGLTYKFKNKTVAELGSVSPASLKQFDISQPVYYALIHWEMLLNAFSKKDVTYSEIPKFPFVKRDLALLLDQSVQYRQIEELAFSLEKKFLKEVNLFDIYQDKKLGSKKSYAVSFTLLNKEATLTEKQIETVMDKLISGYKEKLGAELR
jgi:phenylalanyl-tRNA synthetase beta chain